MKVTMFSAAVLASLLSLSSLTTASPLERRQTAPIDASSLEGKFLYGYQGFFRRPGQGNDHWAINYGEIPGPSTPGDVQFDVRCLPSVLNTSTNQAIRPSQL
jgi:hypothetical protein